MVLKVALLYLLVAQTSASLFDDFRGAFSSMGSSVGGVLSTVAGDVKETFECTVHAVRKAISSNYTPSEYYKKCGYEEPVTNQEQVIKIPPGQTIEIFINSVPVNPAGESKQIREVKPSPEPVTESKPERYDDEELSRRLYRRRLEDAEAEFESESRHFAFMNLELQRELELLSKNLNENMERIDEYEKKLLMERVQDEMKHLHDEEVIYKHEIEDEIRKLMEELQRNSTLKHDIEEDVKTIIQDWETKPKRDPLQEKLEKLREEEIKQFAELKNAMMEQKQKTAPSVFFANPATAISSTTGKPSEIASVTSTSISEKSTTPFIATSTQPTTTSVLPKATSTLATATTLSILSPIISTLLTAKSITPNAASTLPTITSTLPTISFTLPAISSTSSTISSTSPTISSTSPTISSTSPTISSTSPTISSTLSAISSTPPTISSTSPTISSTLSAISSTPPTISSTSPTISSTLSAISSTPPTISSPSPTISSTLSAISFTLPSKASTLPTKTSTLPTITPTLPTTTSPTSSTLPPPTTSIPSLTTSTLPIPTTAASLTSSTITTLPTTATQPITAHITSTLPTSTTKTPTKLSKLTRPITRPRPRLPKANRARKPSRPPKHRNHFKRPSTHVITTTTTSTPTPPTTTSTITPTKEPDYEALISTDKQTIDEAKKLMDEGAQTASFMDNILQNIETAANIFDNPGLLFG